MKNIQFVSITDAGQLTVPARFREKLDIKGKTKAIIQLEGDKLIVKPKLSFKQLSGSLKTDISLTDKQLKKARASFERNWANG
mgnify:CR=1 FL=1